MVDVDVADRRALSLDADRRVAARVAEPGRALHHPPLEVVAAGARRRGHREGEHHALPRTHAVRQRDAARAPGGVVRRALRAELEAAGGGPGGLAGVLHGDAHELRLARAHAGGNDLRDELGVFRPVHGHGDVRGRGAEARRALGHAPLEVEGAVRGRHGVEVEGDVLAGGH